MTLATVAMSVSGSCARRASRSVLPATAQRAVEPHEGLVEERVKLGTRHRPALIGLLLARPLVRRAAHPAHDPPAGVPVQVDHEVADAVGGVVATLLVIRIVATLEGDQDAGEEVVDQEVARPLQEGGGDGVDAQRYSSISESSAALPGQRLSKGRSRSGTDTVFSRAWTSALSSRR